MADAPAPTSEPVAEAPPEPLKYKTWILKVSIHCEGCKRKVKRILLGIEGVYTIDVDAKAHKVVVTGNIEAETLIKKLEKSGKHAELWSDPQSQPKKKKNKSKNKQNNPVDSPGASEEEKPEAENGQPPGERVEVVFSGGVEPGKMPENTRANQPPGSQEANGADEDEGPAENTGNGGGGGGSGKRRKKKKGKKGNNNNNPNNSGQPPNQVPVGGGGEPTGNNYGNNGGEGPPNMQLPPPPPYQGPGGAPGPVNQCVPLPMYEYNRPPPPPGYYPPQQPPIQAAVGYNTAYPPSSYGASYYAAPPPPYSYVRRYDEPGYGYASGGLVASQRPSDTFEIFSDENPNACSVM